MAKQSALNVYKHGRQPMLQDHLAPVGTTHSLPGQEKKKNLTNLKINPFLVDTHSTWQGVK